MSEEVLGGREGADATMVDGVHSECTSKDPTEKDADGSRTSQSLPYVEEVLRDLEEISCQDAPEVKLAHSRDIYEKMGQILSRSGEYKEQVAGYGHQHWRGDRVKIMRALGACLKRCKKVFDFGLGGLAYLPSKRHRLDFSEIEELMQGLVDNTHLRELVFSPYLYGYLGFSWMEDDMFAARIADILHSAENLEVLTFNNQLGHKFRMGRYLPRFAEALTCKRVSNLQKLDFSENKIADEEEFMHLSNILDVACKLKHLRIVNTNLDRGGAKVLGRAVALHKELETLELNLDETGWEEMAKTSTTPGPVDRFIREAFLGPCPNTSVKRLRFYASSRDRATTTILQLEILSELLRFNSSVAELVLSSYCRFFLSCDLRNLFEALRANHSIRVLNLPALTVARSRSVNPTGLGFDSGALHQLVEWIATESGTTLEHLDLTFVDGPSSVDDLELNWPALFKAVASNSTLRYLHLVMPTIQNAETSEAVQKEMEAWLRGTRLKQLHIEGSFLWETLLRSLRANTYLEELGLPRAVLSRDSEFRELMNLLEINSVLQRIEFYPRDSEDGSRKAQVSEALTRNARQVELQATFHAPRPWWTDPSWFPVFLCGNPCTGKTRLASSFTTLNQSFLKRLKEKLYGRVPRFDTEIHVLRNDKSMRVCLWDFPGQQRMFLALQEYRFPKVTRPCVFLFLFSLYDWKTRAVRPNLQLGDALEKEFRHWINFIVSSLQMTGFSRPIVMVALTHADEMDDISQVMEKALPVLEKLRKEFDDVLAVYPSPFLVDCRSKKAVRPILTEVYDAFQDRSEQVNPTLQRSHINTPHSGNENRETQVSKALTCEARHETYPAELRANFETTRWVHPNCGRVFLCGDPTAGKTQLAHTMLQLETPWYTRVREKFIPRTRGIEIQVLRNDESMQVSLWDLAGQDIFRALQEYLFPKRNKACVFLFVFSLYDRKAKALKEPTLEHALEKELRRWLKFIISYTVTGFNLPTVMVVLTHKDKTQISSKWALPIVEKFRKEFDDVLTICPSAFFINGRQKKDVKEIVSEVYKGFDNLFQQKLFSVPEACCQLSSYFLTWAVKNDKQPVLMREKFVSLCTAHPALKDSLRNHSDEEKLKVIRPIVSYLHDVGTIIELDQDIIVVNPNWLTHAFLGSFISTGKDFQRPPGKNEGPPRSKNGFLSKSQFEQFMTGDVQPALKKESRSELDTKMLQTLMEGLDLCFEVTSGDGRPCSIFVPTLFNVEQQSQLQWKVEKMKHDASYLGLRIRCKDQRRTSLSVGFFARFQISLWRKMIQRLSNKLSYDCKYNLISISHDGHDVLVEHDADGSFVDILARSEKSRESVWVFVEKHVVQELYDFCAVGKGPPGVTLVVDVLRTECVKQLTKCEYRKTQAISRETLKEELKKSIREQGDKLDEKSGDLFMHTWEEVPNTSLTYEHEAALDLLSMQDIREVREWVRSETTALTNRAKQSDEVLHEIWEESSGSTVTGFSKELRSLEERSEDHMPLNPEIPAFHCPQLQNMIQEVGENVKEMRGDVKELLVKMDELRADFIRVTAQFVKAQKTAQDSFTRLFQQMVRLTGIPGSSSQLPSRPYFTAEGASLSHRIKAKINVGDPLILHFACENRNGNHTVPNQNGFELIVGEENKEWLRVILRNSVKALWCLLKVGLHVATSLGAVLPDLQLQVSDSKYASLATLSASSVLDIVQPKSTSASNVVDIGSAENSSGKKAWRYLQEHLRGQLVGKIPHYFSLYLALYKDSTETGNLPPHAWLCKECKEEGIAEGRIHQ